MRLDDMRGLVPYYLHIEFADARVAQHLPECLGIGRRGQQVPQSLLFVLIIGHDQGFALSAHGPFSATECRPMNSSISRS